MDWELYERYRSTLLLAGLLFFSALLFAFQKTSSVQYLRAFLVGFALPPQRFLTQIKTPLLPSAPASQTFGETVSTETVTGFESFRGEERRKIQVLSEENGQLREVLGLKKENWPRA